MSINQVVLSGRLGRDPEMRYTQSGKAVVSFSIAVDRRGKDAGADWFTIQAWERLAELCNEFLTKGSKVTVVGRLTTREWEGKDGGKRTATEVVATDVDFGPRAQAQGEPGPAKASGGEYSPRHVVAKAKPAGGYDDDKLVPF